MVKALVHLLCQGDLQAAKRESERALELNPYYPVSLFSLGQALNFDGDAETGIALCRKALAANPRLPMNHAFMYAIGLGHFVLGNYPGAVEWTQRSDQQAGDVPGTLLCLATAASLAGEQDLAAGTVGRLLKIHPDMTLRRLRRQPFRNAEDWQRFLDGLRQAGMPE